MYKHHVAILTLVFLMSFLASFYLHKVVLTEPIVSNIITFLSITFGFYMTSLSVLYSSKYLEQLYSTIDKKKPNQRKVHTLTSYFKYSAYWNIFSIFLLIVLSLIFGFQKEILDVNRLITSFIIAVVLVNFVFLFLLFQVFVNGLIEEAKSRSTK